jgi:hypothetical protein
LLININNTHISDAQENPKITLTIIISSGGFTARAGGAAARGAAQNYWEQLLIAAQVEAQPPAHQVPALLQAQAASAQRVPGSQLTSPDLWPPPTVQRIQSVGPAAARTPRCSYPHNSPLSSFSSSSPWWPAKIWSSVPL